MLADSSKLWPPGTGTFFPQKPSAGKSLSPRVIRPFLAVRPCPPLLAFLATPPPGASQFPYACFQEQLITLLTVGEVNQRLSRSSPPLSVLLFPILPAAEHPPGGTPFWFEDSFFHHPLFVLQLHFPRTWPHPSGKFYKAFSPSRANALIFSRRLRPLQAQRRCF